MAAIMHWISSMREIIGNHHKTKSPFRAGHNLFGIQMNQA
jgi:hypothetical protein